MERFPDWLMKELKSRDMTQSDLSRLAGLGSGTISNIMNGTRKVGQDTLVKIAHALKLPSETVFRAAGLLPPESKKDELISKIIFFAEKLSDQEKEDILEFVRLRHRIALEREKKEIKRGTNQSIKNKPGIP